ncbi:MAG: DUF4857 domain-containing protein [Litorilituus sp.]|jgi:hypothetical protein|nr:DUF4857 domain-containing protein [Litorilituus sp.]
MIVLARHFIIFIAVALLSYWLPRLYDTLLFERSTNPSVNYSVVENDFYIGSKYEKTMHYQSATTGEFFLWKDMQEKLPLRAYRQLQLEKRLPKQVNGIPISVAEIEAWRKRFKYDPRWQDAPDYSIFQLFESNGEHATLQATDQLIRIANGINVYRTETNEILEQASIQIQQAFDDEGFKFPAKLAMHNSKSNKLYEEGLYAIDQQGHLFHGRIFNGDFIIHNLTQLADGYSFDQRLADLDVAFLQVDEFNRGNIRALIIDTSNQLYLLKAPGYQLLPLPIGDFDYTRDRFNLSFNPVYMELTVYRDEKRDKYIINHQGKLLNQYSQTLQDQSTHWSQQLKTWLFPFELSLSDSKHVLANPELIAFSSQVLMVHLLLLILITIWRIHKRQAVMSGDLLWVAATGVFGLIALLMIPRKNNSL